MATIGNKISEKRKLKGITQEELADLSKINLRTIQRIENSKNEPRGKTLSLICEALEIDSEELKITQQTLNRKKKIEYIIDILFLIVLNFLMISVFGFLTLDSNANLNSRVGCFLLSFFIPFFIVQLTPNLQATERILKFGTGNLFYIVLIVVFKGIKEGFIIGITSGLFFCLIVTLGVLFYGDKLNKSKF